VSVAALLRAEPRRPVAYVRARALEALYQYVNPFTGGPDGDGWPFDHHLTSAAVHQLLSGVDGVAEVGEVLFFDYDLRNMVRVGSAKEIVKLEPEGLFLSAVHAVVVR